MRRESLEPQGWVRSESDCDLLRRASAGSVVLRSSFMDIPEDWSSLAPKFEAKTVFRLLPSRPQVHDL